MKPVVIIDYGMGNLRSVQKALEKVGQPAVITSDANRIKEAGKVVLPGVGAFRDAIARLREGGLVEPLVEHMRMANTRGSIFLLATWCVSLTCRA
jgi:glutamine amidotransferase